MAQRPATAASDDVVDALLADYDAAPAAMQHVNSYELPSTELVARLVDQCRALFFPGYVGSSLARITRTELRDQLRERVDELRNGLRRQVYRGLHHKSQRAVGGNDLDCPDCAESADRIANAFVQRLPELRAEIARDVLAADAGDPAATGADEIIFCYPGVFAITVYRIAHALLQEGAALIPRMMTELAHERTGIDIHPGAIIGHSFFIDHGTGVVIGETSLIGNNVRLYQGVTLGALSVAHGERPPPGSRRHPTLEDDVVIYAGATILGGATVIGRGAVVGGNCWVTTSVDPGTVVTAASQRSRRDA